MPEPLKDGSRKPRRLPGVFPSPDALLDLVAAAFQRARLPGLAVCVVAQGDLRLCQGIGSRISGDTRFPIASCTKPFTAELLLQQADAGSLDLDQPLRGRWPDYSLADSSWSDALTPRDLLCHRQPLPPHPWAWIFSGEDRSQFFSRRMPHLDLDPGAARDRHLYSNLQYAALGRLLEILSGECWEADLDRLAAGLGMSRTGDADEHWAVSDPNTAAPHSMRPEGPLPIAPFHARKGHPIAPASELLSTAHDLGLWLDHLLAHPRERRPEVFIPSSSADPRLGPLGYSLGWRTQLLHGKPHHWHSGQCSGYTALLSLRPDTRTGVALLCNADGALPVLQRLLHTLLDLTEGRPAQNWDEAFPLHRPDPTPPPAAIPPALEGCCALRPGRFEHPGYGRFTVESRDGLLRGALQGSTWSVIGRGDDSSLFWNPPGYRTSIPLEWRAESLVLHAPGAPRPIRFRRTG